MFVLVRISEAKDYYGTLSHYFTCSLIPANAESDFFDFKEMAFSDYQHLPAAILITTWLKDSDLSGNKEANKVINGMSTRSLKYQGHFYADVITAAAEEFTGLSLPDVRTRVSDGVEGVDDNS